MSDDETTDDADDSNSNVITVAFGVETTLATIVGGRECRHHSYKVHEDTRAVFCGACKAPLDPFQLLLEYARKERNWRWYEKDERETRKRIHALEDEEKKIKARTRNASRKEAELAVAAERRRSLEKRQQVARNARQIVELGQRILRAVQTVSDDETPEPGDTEDASTQILRTPG